MNSTLMMLLLAGILLLGFLAQWLAWRVRLPAILFLLLTGLVLGPVAGVLQPDSLVGDLLFPMVSLAVAIILFEGSLGLRLTELSDIGRAVRGMITYGAVATWVGLAAAAHWIAGLSWELAFLFGALGCVTGPTVVAPMLRTVRPNQKVANLLRWEGILIDPIGALFAVLVYEAIISHTQGHSIWVFFSTVIGGAVIGLAAAFMLGFLLRRFYIPEYLQSYGTLAVVLAAFAGSNAVVQESGLLAVTVMGMALGNMRSVNIEDILDFKENLSTLLISVLFILLAARLTWPLPEGVLLAGLLLYLFAQFIMRPLAVAIGTWRSRLNWRERALVAWIAPRGIVAAAVSALFALKLEALGRPGADTLVPLIFILIIATVVVQSASARPLARLLRVTAPDPTGVLIYGSNPVALAMANALRERDVPVLVADDNWNGIRTARMQGLETYFGNPTSLHASRYLNLSAMGRLLAMSTHREMNTIACLRYREQFGRSRVYRLRNLAPGEGSDRIVMASPLLAPPLFTDEMTNARFQERLDQGWRVKSTLLGEEFDWSSFLDQYGDDVCLLFAQTDKGVLRIASAKRPLQPKPGWTVTALVPPAGVESPA